MANLIDMHSHFLPGIDDGCKKVKDSITLLEMSAEQGVDVICGTPHYYSTCSIPEFLALRQGAINEVMDGIMKYQRERMDRGELSMALPKIRLGAEVAYNTYILQQDNLIDLCYEGTNYLLLEMPFEEWQPRVLSDVKSLIDQDNIIPVIAHIERFYQFNSKKTINELLDLPVMVQMNAEYIINEYHKAKKLIKKELIHVIGSDCHRPNRRTQNIGLAADILFKKQQHFLINAAYNSEIILKSNYSLR